MKYARFVAAALLAVSLASAGTSGGTDSGVDWSRAEQNYIAGLRSNNAGLQASAAMQIGKYNLTGAVEELKGMLCKNCQEKVKFSVALTLLRIGGEEGRTAVKEALETEENELVAQFYRTILAADDIAVN